MISLLKQVVLLTEKSVYILVVLNFFEKLLDFSQHLKSNGQEISNVLNFLPDLHNNPSTFEKSLGLYRRNFAGF